MVDKILNKIADALAAKITFVVFCFIAFVPLFLQLPHTILEWQQWTSQTAIQLIALNVLGFTTQKESRKTQKIQQETHDTVMLEMAELKQIIAEQQEIMACFGKRKE